MPALPTIRIPLAYLPIIPLSVFHYQYSTITSTQYPTINIPINQFPISLSVYPIIPLSVPLTVSHSTNSSQLSVAYYQFPTIVIPSTLRSHIYHYQYSISSIAVSHYQLFHHQYCSTRNTFTISIPLLEQYSTISIYLLSVFVPPSVFIHYQKYQNIHHTTHQYLSRISTIRTSTISVLHYQNIHYQNAHPLSVFNYQNIHPPVFSYQVYPLSEHSPSEYPTLSEFATSIFIHYQNIYFQNTIQDMYHVAIFWGVILMPPRFPLCDLNLWPHLSRQACFVNPNRGSHTSISCYLFLD